VAAAAAVLTIVLGAVTTWAYAFPRIDQPTRSDAVLVLGPPTVQRLRVALQLVDDGVVNQIVISVPADVRDDDEHTLVRDLCRGDTDYPVECITPDPFTTQGEARLASELLTEEDWRSMIVVTSITHISRARMLFDRCIPGSDEGHRVAFVSDHRDYDLGRWVSEYVYQTGAWIKAIISPDC
jgi:hypothetical protein